MKEKKRGKKVFRILLIILLTILILATGLFLGGYFYVKNILSTAERVTLDESDLGIGVEISEIADSDRVETMPVVKSFPEGITSIALFGLDTRDIESNQGRSDSIFVITADSVHKKIKVTSFARDSYVYVEGYGKTKLCHAYVYGGPQLAVKTLNQNFGLNIKDFATVNFSQFASIIDYLGGVTVNVTQAELKVMEEYFEELNTIGIATEPLTKTGDVLLTGGQALAYSRNRYTGNDVDRMNRQYEVLLAMAEKAKKLKPSQYDDFVKMILSESTTSLTDEEILSIGYWLVKDSPEICRYVLPNDECRAGGKTINGTWYFVYDNMEVVRKNLRRFIFES